MKHSQFNFLGRLDLPDELTRDPFYADMFERYLGQTSLEYPSLNFTIPYAYETLVDPLFNFLQKHNGFKIAESYPKEFDMPLYEDEHKNAKMKAFRLPGNWCEDCKEGLSLNWVICLRGSAHLLFREGSATMNEVQLLERDLFVMDWGLPHRFHSDKAGAGLVMVQLALVSPLSKECGLNSNPLNEQSS